MSPCSSSNSVLFCSFFFTYKPFCWAAGSRAMPGPSRSVSAAGATSDGSSPPHRYKWHWKIFVSPAKNIFYQYKIFLTQSKLRPQKFYGVSRRNVETKVEVPDAQDDDEDTTEEAEKNRIILWTDEPEFMLPIIRIMHHLLYKLIYFEHCRNVKLEHYYKP